MAPRRKVDQIVPPDSTPLSHSWRKSVSGSAGSFGGHPARYCFGTGLRPQVILQGRSSKETTVAEIMTADLVTVTPETTIDQAMGVMTQYRIRHLPVLDGGACGDCLDW